MSAGFRPRLALAIAWAEMKGGLAGFRLFIACLAIGVAAMSAAGNVAAAFRAGLAAEQTRLLGGDVALELRMRAPDANEIGWFQRHGRTSLVHTLNVMAGAAGGDSAARRQVQVRAVDGAYPLVGTVGTRPAGPLPGLLARRDGFWGALVEPAAAEAMDLRVGDRIALPQGEVEVRGILQSEPDALGRGFAFAPRVMIASGALSELALGQPGSLFNTSLRVVLAPGVDRAAFQSGFAGAFPDAARNLRDVSRQAQGFGRALERLEVFLSCVGFAALIAGGLGVSGAVQAHLAGRRASIAVFKTLGGSGAEARLAWGAQIACMGLAGALAGAVFGGLAPWALAAVWGASAPAPLDAALHPGPTLGAFAIGCLAALAFAAGPLGQARATPPADLLRGAAGSTSVAVPWPERLFALALLAAMAALYALTSPDPLLAAGLAAGSATGWLAFFALGKAAQALARRAPKPPGTWGWGLAGLGGPGSLAPIAAPALGLGLALLAGLGQIQSNLVTQVRDTAPARAPSVAFTGIPDEGAAAFDALVRQVAPGLGPDAYARTPVANVRVTAINGRDIDPAAVPASERWFVENEVAATWMAAAPPDAALTAGAWWSAQEAADPERLWASVEAEAAAGLGLKPGDRLSVFVSGRTLDVEVANLRRVDFGGFGANFALILSPGPLAGAGFRHAAIARMSAEAEARLTARLAGAFPEVIVVRVRDALAAAAGLFDSLAWAVQAVAGVALVAGVLAVGGALAAGARRRMREAAILQALGASRARIMAALGLEMGAAGLAAGIPGIGLGLLAAWFVVTQGLEAQWSLDLTRAAAIAGGAVLAFVAAGALAGFAALSRPPARALQASG